MRYNLNRLLSVFAVTTIAAAMQISSVSAAPQPPRDNPLEDLGKNLLDDATLDQLIEAAKRDDPPPSDRTPNLLPKVDRLRQMLDPKRQHAPNTGEDIGQPQESPLERISDRMAQAGELMASQTAPSETRAMQEEIVLELDKLIDKLNKQCSQCKSSSRNKPGSQQSQNSTPKPGASKPSASQGSTASPVPSQVSEGGGGEAEPGEVVGRDSAKQLWGQLPEQLRQQLLQSTADEFLPKYREDLELYFRRLAEEQRDVETAR